MVWTTAFDDRPHQSQCCAHTTHPNLNRRLGVYDLFTYHDEAGQPLLRVDPPKFKFLVGVHVVAGRLNLDVCALPGLPCFSFRV